MAIFMTYVLKMTPFFQMENHTKAHYFLIWQDSLCVPPTKIDLNNYIPNGYIVSRGGIPSSERKIKLKANSTYTISSTGLGAVECRIKAWTNRNGKILKAVKY